MKHNDVEIDAWRAEWIAQSPVTQMNPADLRRKAVRQQRSLRIRQVLELLTAVVFLVFSVVVVRGTRQVEFYLWAAVVWAGTITATAFSLRTWHILWKADLKSVAEFTLEYRRRCLARLRAARFGQWFLGIQVIISSTWLSLDYFRQRMTGGKFAGSVLVLAALTAGFALWFSHQRRIAKKELAEVGRADPSLNPVARRTQAPRGAAST